VDAELTEKSTSFVHVGPIVKPLVNHEDGKQILP
jgi:hypothetical protein